MYLTDSHAHIHMKPFRHEPDSVIKRAADSNVHRIITIGTELKDSIDAAAMAKKYPNIYAAVGVHPHYAEKFSYKDLGTFEKLLAEPKVLAVGEVGLDYYRNLSPKGAQIEAFKMMIDLAVSSCKPIIIHTRDAAEDTLKTLEEMLDGNDYPILFHCFSGEKLLLEWGMGRKNVMFSFAGNVTYPQAVALHKALDIIPVKKLLIETDCPYLTPVPKRGKQNEPSYLPYTAEYVANSKGMSLEKLMIQLEENITSYFHINGVH